MIIALPTAISALRFVLGLMLFVTVNLQQHMLSMSLIVMAAFSDFLDGFCARYFSCQTYLGTCIDPIADKFFFFCLFTALLINHHVPPFMYALFLGRDLMIVAGGAALSLKKIEIKPSFISKVNTVLLFIYPIIILMPQTSAFMVKMMQNAVIVTTILSGFGYIMDYLKR